MRKLERYRVEKMGRWNEVNVLGGREKVRVRKVGMMK